MINPKSQKALDKIVASYLDLLNLKSYEKITIKEIMGNAGVARSVFYSHFKTKDDVFNYLIDHLFYSFLKEHITDEEYFTSDQIIWDYIKLYDEYSHIFLLLQYNNVDVLLTKKMFSEIKNSLHLSSCQDNILKEYAHYYLPYLISSIVAVTMNWVRSGKKESKEELLEIIKHFKYR